MLRPILASTLSLDCVWIVQNTRRTWNIEQLFNPIPFHTTGFHIRRIFVFHIFTSIFQSKREYYRPLFTIKRSLQPSIVNDSQNDICVTKCHDYILSLLALSNFEQLLNINLSYTSILSSTHLFLPYFQFYFLYKREYYTTFYSLTEMSLKTRNECQNYISLSDVLNTRNTIKSNHSTILPFHTYDFSLRMLLLLLYFHFHFSVKERILCHLLFTNLNESQNYTSI